LIIIKEESRETYSLSSEEEEEWRKKYWKELLLLKGEEEVFSRCVLQRNQFLKKDLYNLTLIIISNLMSDECLSEFVSSSFLHLIASVSSGEIRPFLRILHWEDSLEMFLSVSFLI
jgi:hypothetical protein